MLKSWGAVLSRVFENFVFTNLFLTVFLPTTSHRCLGQKLS